MNRDLNNSNNEPVPQIAQNQEASVALSTDGSVLRLLEERLVVDRSKRKIGEVTIRKETHTRIVEVPVRYERLIVEQVSSNPQQLAVIDLGYGEVTGIEPELQNLDRVSQNSVDTVGLRVNFTSLEYANQVLNQLAQMLKNSDESPQIEIVLKDQNSQAAYLSWLDRQSY